VPLTSTTDPIASRACTSNPRQEHFPQQDRFENLHSRHLDFWQPRFELGQTQEALQSQYNFCPLENPLWPISDLSERNALPASVGP